MKYLKEKKTRDFKLVAEHIISDAVSYRERQDSKTRQLVIVIILRETFILFYSTVLFDFRT